jgi:hypothetical protein
VALEPIVEPWCPLSTTDASPHGFTQIINCLCDCKELLSYGSFDSLNTRSCCVKALAWHGKHDVRCESVPDPRIEHPRDAIIKVTACAICGSDLHIYNGIIPRMKSGDVLGHENMGEVVEVGADNKKLKVGDRVVVPFTIACGECFFCKNGFFSGCERRLGTRTVLVP